MSLSYIFLSLFAAACLFSFFTYLRVLEKGRFITHVQGGLALVGRNSLMFVYAHYFAIFYLKLDAWNLGATAALLVRATLFFIITLFFLFIYDRIKNDYQLFLPVLLFTILLALFRYGDLFSLRSDSRLIDILIGMLFAFLYVQLRSILRRFLKKKEEA